MWPSITTHAGKKTTHQFQSTFYTQKKGTGFDGTNNGLKKKTFFHDENRKSQNETQKSNGKNATQGALCSVYNIYSIYTYTHIRMQNCHQSQYWKCTLVSIGYVGGMSRLTAAASRRGEKGRAVTSPNILYKLLVMLATRPP